MNREQIKGQCKQLQGDARQQWGKLIDNVMAQIEGARDTLVGTPRERCTTSTLAPERAVDGWSAQEA